MLVTFGDNERASSMVLLLLLGKERRPFGGMLLRKEGRRSNVAWEDWRLRF
jgi:hypothetical protein